jgi:transcription antitermination factor NusG
MEKYWNAIYVSSRQEKKVVEFLQKKNIESYLPLVRTLRQWSDRKKMVEFPLIPGYVFVRLKNEIEKDIVMQSKGVVNYVRSNGKIGVVYEEEIAALQQLISLGYHLESFPGTKKINKGDRISISSGPLKNLEGIVLEENDQSIFEIFLEGIGYNVRVRLPEGVLKRVN